MAGLGAGRGCGRRRGSAAPLAPGCQPAGCPPTCLVRCHRGAILLTPDLTKCLLVRGRLQGACGGAAVEGHLRGAACVPHSLPAARPASTCAPCRCAGTRRMRGGASRAASCPRTKPTRSARSERCCGGAARALHAPLPRLSMTCAPVGPSLACTPGPLLPLLYPCTGARGDGAGHQRRAAPHRLH